jgi:signal transduction histidine kinase
MRGVASPQREQVDLARIARSVEQRLRARAPGRRIEITVDEPLVASADPALVERTLGYLLEQSWEVTRARAVAHVHVGGTIGPDGTAFFVRDDGLGAADADDPDLAELADALHAQGGRIWTEATPGAGATIYFTLGR